MHPSRVGNNHYLHLICRRSRTLEALWQEEVIETGVKLRIQLLLFRAGMIVTSDRVVRRLVILIGGRLCENRLELFLTTYFKGAFALEFSDDHKKVIAGMETAILLGGLFAVSLPRGGGKTTLATRASLWALLYGHRKFVCLVGATSERAAEILKTIKTELTWNPLITADFRAATHPLIKLQGNARLSLGQLWDGQPTRCEWGNRRLVLGCAPQAVWDGFKDVSGSVVSTCGITSALRGQMHTLPNGDVIRPTLAILDDPQTRRSAMSPSQCQSRLELVNADVLAMSGPGESISAIACLTPIRAGDLADTLLNAETSPRWHPQRHPMLHSIPTAEQHWDTYKQILDEDLRRGGDGTPATEYYRANQIVMDTGGKAGWPARKLPEQESAIEHGMALKLTDETTFAAEFQGEPLTPDLGASLKVDAETIAAKVNDIPQGDLPVGVQYVTAYIDCQETALFYVVAGWSPQFDGYITAYNTWPPQNTRYFTLRKLTQTLGHIYPNCGREAAVRKGLLELTSMLCTIPFKREDGATLRIDKLFIDSGWLTHVVYDVCAHSPHAGQLLAAKGDGITAARTPINEYDRRRGDLIGFNWWLPGLLRNPNRGERHIIIDTNFFKSFVHARMGTQIGDPGSLSLFGSDPIRHKLFADHLTAETPTRTFGRGRALDEWKVTPGRDNHWFDCVTGCAAAASLCGAALDGLGARPPKQPRPKQKMSDLQASAQTRRGGHVGGPPREFFNR